MQPLHRRRFLHLATGAAALAGAPRFARAESYPTRPLRWIVGFAPGGGNDIVARLMGQWLSERLGQPVVVENRPGAATNVAAAMVARAPADGYTVFLVSPPNAINATLYGKLTFNFIRDIAPIAAIVTTPNVMVVNPSVPAQTVAEFIAYAKANPGKVNMGSPGVGTSVHLSGELFNMMAGVKMVHVPYRGASLAVTDLLGGQVQVVFGTMPSVIEHVKAGKLRALAVTTAKRSAALPTVPTVGESVPGYEVSGWFGMGAPAATPGEIVARLNKEINAGLADPAMKAKFAEMGGTALGGSPADFGKLIADETEKWGKVVHAADLKAD
ncbi:MAG: tripartite tricarboxylate transporter substrate binding protein [Alphaproteobacteria bacterium]|nr:tripartite tricarboxylate transporter substrate binding protein [Alphaproteobacteria bacterium]